MSKRLLALLAALAISTTAVACDDNAEDHAAEATEETREGDTENAAESREDAREDLAQGDTTDGIN
ncbi:MAG TPA: hypothetical protein VGV85_16720 [Longimicrobiaceae bacterium]|jgi:hypothetical protein|nr:hypothetical protein [Longimicrobiaceae bacterium]